MTTQQRPLGSGLDRDSTADQALGAADLTGKTVVVTGASSGLGTETARVLAQAGAKIIAAVRSPERAKAALAGVKNVQIEQLDLADPASIDAFVARVEATGTPVHILINNAGVMACPLARDARGYEMQFATNHLGHFQLTAGLWPALKRANGARVVTLSSGAHRRSPVLFDDINFETTEYEKFKAYGQAKSANALFSVGLDQRGQKDGVRAFAVHPGIIHDTNLFHFLSSEEMSQTAGALGATKTIPQGAATTVWAATSPMLEGHGGVYCENGDIAEGVPADKQTPGGVRPWAVDPALADRLWSVSEKMTGKSFPG
ncbi:SDR family NAD(P)-dependent oxidoreductase [Phenylobacterium sp.]|uniref:SDR family NAD(P)-dependent oxidoreductase n=1 Tax=Phenylobacterium sp. TaxID=1871053 RepID=UPI0027325A6A|nr:SDR family NAD(P)-dependent oxidoreductase [Phenylobacterium sp.]MDP3659191.1 SDR family NAD(P)-dependent oxidoreductase [Phenylobacterium sp.]